MRSSEHSKLNNHLIQRGIMGTDREGKKLSAANVLVFLYVFLSYTVNMLTSEGSRIGGVLLIGLIILLFGVVSFRSEGIIRIKITLK